MAEDLHSEFTQQKRLQPWPVDPHSVHLFSWLFSSLQFAFVLIRDHTLDLSITFYEVDLKVRSSSPLFLFLPTATYSFKTKVRSSREVLHFPFWIHRSIPTSSGKYEFWRPLAILPGFSLHSKCSSSNPLSFLPYLPVFFNLQKMSTSISNTSLNLTGPPKGNWCSSGVQENIAVCRNNSTLDVDYHQYYCSLNTHAVVQECLKDYSDKFGGDGGIQCHFEDQDNGSAFGAQTNTKTGLGLLILVVVGLLNLSFIWWASYFSHCKS